MNFLSHYYFDRSGSPSYQVLGTVLPDLAKNANGNWKLHPLKKAELFKHDPELALILAGWTRHLAVDKIFHASPFFEKHTQNIRSIVAPLLNQSVVRPSFLAHISLELLLDGLLLQHDLVNAEELYRHLENTQNEKIENFFRLNEIEDPAIFFDFFERFLSSRYLNSYRDSRQITYALNRICMRIWPEGLKEIDQEKLALALLDYQQVLAGDFRNIFEDIDRYLDTLSNA